MSRYTLIDTERALSRDADAGAGQTISVHLEGDRILADADGFSAATGWTLEPQGFCRGDVCVPLGDAEAAVDGRIDLAAYAAVTGRPLAVDREAGALLLGTASSDCAARLAGLEAPDVELPDLTGQLHRLSDHRGKKVLLIAYASW